MIAGQIVVRCSCNVSQGHLFESASHEMKPQGCLHHTQDVPQIEIEEQVVEVPVAKHVQVPMIQKVQKMVEVPQVEYDDQVVDVPVQKQVHIPFQQARATKKAPKSAEITGCCNKYTNTLHYFGNHPVTPSLSLNSSSLLTCHILRHSH